MHISQNVSISLKETILLLCAVGLVMFNMKYEMNIYIICMFWSGRDPCSTSPRKQRGVWRLSVSLRVSVIQLYGFKCFQSDRTHITCLIEGFSPQTIRILKLENRAAHTCCVFRLYAPFFYCRQPSLSCMHMCTACVERERESQGTRFSLVWNVLAIYFYNSNKHENFKVIPKRNLARSVTCS